MRMKGRQSACSHTSKCSLVTSEGTSESELALGLREQSTSLLNIPVGSRVAITRPSPDGRVSTWGCISYLLLGGRRVFKVFPSVLGMFSFSFGTNWQSHLYVVVRIGRLVEPSLSKYGIWSRSSSNENGDEKLPESSSVMCRKSAGKAQACLDPAEVVHLDRLLLKKAA